MKKRLVIGILAHVDSGKTTLSEALLYLSGEIRKLGRVDRRDAFLDTNEIERDRGITIFSKQANFSYGNTDFSLIDTPGHVDFSAETERALGVLDYAILVISAADGVQSHTESLWRVLKKYGVPVILFVNKMDMDTADRGKIEKELKESLDEACLCINSENSESIAMCSEDLMEEYLNGSEFSVENISSALKNRKIFPVLFGSALKTDGVGELLNTLDIYGEMPHYKSDFGARVFKLSTDEKGLRLAHIKLTGGSLKVKDIVGGEKVSEIRIYSGAKYKSVQEVKAGEVCVLTGLNNIYSGQGLGFEADLMPLDFQPVFSYKVEIENNNIDKITALKYLRRLEEEETQLHVVWNPNLQEIQLQLMGEVQSEVLKRIIKERFNMDVTFEQGGIVYKETILNTVEGVGHYEPLRHYAEVHLLLEPGKRGLKFFSDLSEDALDKNWQRLILTHLEEKVHRGVLTGFPITDMKITLIAGRAHQKHTEGGDFRQATYRAVRQGLRKAECVVLEPWYSFRLELPHESVGRAMTDIQNMGGKFESPEIKGERSVISGTAPVISMRDYQKEVVSYTHGLGRLVCTLEGYLPCTNQEEIINTIGYDADADIENTADSVFCAHGAGFTVKWDKVHEYMHLEARKTESEIAEEKAVRRQAVSKGYADEAELIKIFERTYGKIQRKSYQQMKTQKLPESTLKKYRPKPEKSGGEYLLVDGYNVLFAWYDLAGASSADLDFARNLLIERLSNYKAVKDTEIIAVFDAYKVKGGIGSRERVGNISVVYTKEAETADSYIEKTSKELKKNYRVRVATSDRLEQMIIFGGGAERISEKEFLKELEAAEEKIREIIKSEELSGNIYPEHEIKENTRKEGKKE